MYRVLIVDDEPIIADGLYEELQKINHLELDVYRVYSGKAAIELLQKTKVDIVITDIRMPGIDGMQLLKKIYASWPECKVILLTGYKEFDYAYTAIQHKDVSYILKTEGYAKVIGTVEKAVLELEESLKSLNLIKKANEQLGKVSALLQKEYLTSLIHGDDTSPIPNQEELDRLELPLRAGDNVLLIIGRIDLLSNSMKYSEKTKCLYTIKLIMEQHLSSKIECIQIGDNYNNLLWFLQPKQCETTEDIEKVPEKDLWNNSIFFIKEMLETIQIACRKAIGMTVSFAFDTHPIEWRELVEKYDSLRLLIDYRIGSGVEMLLTDKNAQMSVDYQKSSDMGINFKLSLNKLETLGGFLEKGRQNEFFKLFQEITQGFNSITSRHFSPALELYYSISLLFTTYINRWKIEDKISFRIGIYKLFRIEEHESWIDAIAYLIELAKIIFSIQEGEEERRAVDTISNIKTYIDSHISDEISLVKLAEVVYFNPSYLSRLFKQLTGTNLTEYIQEVRIKKAKQFLENSDLKINDIAREVGYGSATNFTRFFKGITGITPQEYRESLL